MELKICNVYVRVLTHKYFNVDIYMSQSKKHVVATNNIELIFLLTHNKRTILASPIQYYVTLTLKSPRRNQNYQTISHHQQQYVSNVLLQHKQLKSQDEKQRNLHDPAINH